MCPETDRKHKLILLRTVIWTANIERGLSLSKQQLGRGNETTAAALLQQDGSTLTCRVYYKAWKVFLNEKRHLFLEQIAVVLAILKSLETRVNHLTTDQ